MLRLALIFGALSIALPAVRAFADQSPFVDAAAVWQLADNSGRTNNKLSEHGNVKLGVDLSDDEKQDSLKRTGDGEIATLDGGYFDCGKSGNDVVLKGSAMSMCIRLRDPSGRWDTSLFSKHGGHGKLVYNLFSADLGGGVVIGFELGADRNEFLVVAPISQLNDARGWHDIVARYDGKQLDLFVDGTLVDSKPATGNLRQNTAVPSILGAEVNADGEIVRPFQGQIDHAALWNRALTDAEICTLSGVSELTRPAYYGEKYRPGYHFSPQQNFMNDPNGLVFFDGQYHLFYQYNPFGNKWGHMSWGHAVSADLVKWEHLPVAFGEENGVMAFSGSAVVDWKNTSGFGKGAPPLVAIYTGHLVAGELQRQDIAYSVDRGRTWAKFQGNPVLDLKGKDFRDPKVFWHAPTNQWIMAVVKADEKKIQFYGSKNLKNWNKLSEFGPAGAPNKPNWECPDLFPLQIDGEKTTKWVLHVGMGGHAAAGGSGGEYFIGDFDGKTFRCDDGPEKVRWTDFGKDFYASVCWSDIPANDGRRIWIGWMSDWQYANDVPTHPWRNAMSIPRSLGLKRIDGELHLTQLPVRELQQLREKEQKFGPLTVEPGAATNKISASGAMLEIDAEFKPGTATEFGFKVRKGLNEETIIGYDANAKQLFVDRRQSGEEGFSREFSGRHAGPLTLENGTVRMRIFVDRASVEVFGNSGETCITDLIFPDPKSVGVELYANEGAAELKSMTVWKLKSIWDKQSAVANNERQ